MLEHKLTQSNHSITPRTTTGVMFASLLMFGFPSFATEELNIMSWCDHSDPEVYRAFEEEHNVRINAKDYYDTSTALTLIQNSEPGDWDVLSLDVTVLGSVVENNPGVLLELDPADFPYDDIFPPMNSHHQYVDGKLYGVVEKFGYNTIAYNSNNVDEADMQSYAALWDDKYAGRIGIFDLYFQQIQTLALVDGLKPDEITLDDLPPIKERLVKMKREGIYIGDVVGIQTALVTGEIDILLGGAEWVVGPIYEEKPEIKWVVPKEGGIYYLLSASVVADSKNPELATEFVQYLLSPPAQAKLSTSSCFWGLPVNTKASVYLTDDQKQVLHWDSQEEYLARSHVNFYSDPELDQAMLDLWTELLQE